MAAENQQAIINNVIEVKTGVKIVENKHWENLEHDYFR